MEYKHICISDIRLGAPLPWDVFDASGTLLLHKGYVVTEHRQAKALIERGWYACAEKTSPTTASENTEVSVLRIINEVLRDLQEVLSNLHNEAHAEARIIEISKSLCNAVEINSDVALACILLNQVSEIYAIRHCADTAIVSILVARTMKKSADEIVSIAAAALTMNIGMLDSHDHFQQRNSTLTNEEIALIRQHPNKSVRALQYAGIRDHDWLAYVMQHHENEDGSGYQQGLSGSFIQQNSKIIALADRYCARVSARSYRKSLLPSIALRDIFIDQGKNIDPMLAAYFIKELGLYPPGTLVSLQNEEIGIVTQKGATPTTPVVHAIIGKGGEVLSSPARRDTKDRPYAIRETLHEKKLSMRFEMHHLWGAAARP